VERRLYLAALDCLAWDKAHIELVSRIEGGRDARRGKMLAPSVAACRG